MRLHQIVASIPAEGESPVVLFDFDEWFKVAQGTDFSQPQVRVSSTWTQLNDGEHWGASTLGDRILRLKLTAFKGNAEDQAEVLQTLGRLLNDSRGQWFLWHDEGTVNERYFRTKRAALSIEDILLLEDPKRIVSIDIPAEPTAYGPKISGQATITNNPRAGAHPMSLVMPPIKGDVQTPLWVRWPQDPNDSARAIVASLAAPPDVAGEFPLYLDMADFPLPALTEFGWDSITDVADATSIGGSRRRAIWDENAPSGGPWGSVPQYFIDNQPIEAPPGDYRVLVRCSTSGDVQIGLTGYTGPNNYNLKTTATQATSHWVDMGITRFPYDAPLVDPAFPGEQATVQSVVTLYALPDFDVDPTGTVNIDGLIFIPADLDEDVDAVIAILNLPPTGFPAATHDVYLDGITETIVYASQGVEPLLLARSHPLLQGGFPRVTPGTENVLTFMRNTALDSPTDSIATTTVLDWAYYPGYLYIRSATG